MPSHSHDNPKQSKNNSMLLYSYLYLLPYILHLPQINSETKPSLSEDALINRYFAQKLPRTVMKNFVATSKTRIHWGVY